MTEMNVNTHIDLLDQDILDIEGGPLAWAKSKQGGWMNMEDFRKTTFEKFWECGFRVNVKCYETNEKDVYAFDVEILARTKDREDTKPFDPEQMGWEVANNILDDPNAEKGWIDTNKAFKEMKASGQLNKKHHH